MKHRYIALDVKVLAVASEGAVKDWAAYIGAVKGNSHDDEAQHVLDYGTKLPYSLAKVLFPDFDEEFRWRP